MVGGNTPQGQYMLLFMLEMRNYHVLIDACKLLQGFVLGRVTERTFQKNISSQSLHKLAAISIGSVS